MGEPAVSPTYCPINGAYTFTYSVNDGPEASLECSTHTSEISDCPYGFGFNLKFKECSFGGMDMSFHCLGDWEGTDGKRYVALMDTQATVEQDNRPRYRYGGKQLISMLGIPTTINANGSSRRCALYEENEMTGEIKFALSSDSTCTNHLRSPVEGYETLTLRPKLQKAWPSRFLGAENCDLPDWAQGKWEHLHVQGGTLLLKDHRNFKTYTGKCVPQTGSSVHPERFLLYTRTQCGDEHYKCVWLKNRGENALEFQIGKDAFFIQHCEQVVNDLLILFTGLYTSPHHNESLCSEENFQERTWTTQGRVEVEDPTPYPIIGEYTGVIPDTEGLCAKLYSDCNNPEIMFYTIFNCFNRTEVYEGKLIKHC